MYKPNFWFSSVAVPSLAAFAASAPAAPGHPLGELVEAKHLRHAVHDVAGASSSALVLVARGADARRWIPAVEPERTSAAVVVVAFHVTVTDPLVNDDNPGLIEQYIALLQVFACWLLLTRPRIFESAAVDPEAGALNVHPLDGGAWHEACGGENAAKRQKNSGGGGNPVEQVAVDDHARPIIQK